MIRVDFEGGAMNFIDLPLEYGMRRPQIIADALPSGDVGGKTIDMPVPDRQGMEMSGSFKAASFRCPQ